METKDIRELIELISRSNFATFEMEREGFRLKLVKDPESAVAAALPVTAPPGVATDPTPTVPVPEPPAAKPDVGLVDMKIPLSARFASLNGENMMYAASLPKIAVLLAATEAIERGELQETAAVRSDMWMMINKSNNAATTRMIDRLGFKKIAEVMQDPRYLLYDREYGGGLWVGKRYAAGGQRSPDPMKGISHAATADQVCRFYYLLATGQLVSRNGSAQMLKYMGNPGLHHKFVNTLDRIAPTAQVYRKSGSWSVYHADSALVWGPQRRYILVALIEDGSGEAICRQLVSSVERALDKSRLLAEGY